MPQRTLCIIGVAGIAQAAICKVSVQNLRVRGQALVAVRRSSPSHSP